MTITQPIKKNMPLTTYIVDNIHVSYRLLGLEYGLKEGL